MSRGMLDAESEWPKFVESRDGLLVGRVTSASRRCRLEGCGGVRLRVVWPDGKVTYPCSRGLVGAGKPDTWKID